MPAFLLAIAFWLTLSLSYFVSSFGLRVFIKCNCIGTRETRRGEMCTLMPDERSEEGNKVHISPRNGFPSVQYYYIAVPRFIEITLWRGRSNDLLLDDLH